MMGGLWCGVCGHQRGETGNSLWLALVDSFIRGMITESTIFESKYSPILLCEEVPQIATSLIALF